MDDFEKGFSEELEKIGQGEQWGRILGDPIRQAAEAVGGGLGQAGQVVRGVGEGVMGGAGEIGAGLRGFGEQSGITHALRTASPDIQAGHLIGAGLGAGLGGVGGYLAGKKATGTTAGGLAGAGLGAVGGAGLGAGAGHLIGGHLRGKELAEQAAAQQEMAGDIHTLRSVPMIQAARARAGDMREQAMRAQQEGLIRQQDVERAADIAHEMQGRQAVGEHERQMIAQAIKNIDKAKGFAKKRSAAAHQQELEDLAGAALG